MFNRASLKLGMEQALFQKGAFGVSTSDNDLSKIDSKEVEQLLKYGAYAFLEEEGNSEVDDNDDGILKKKSNNKKGV